MQVFDIAIAPGGARFIDVQAAYIYFLNGSAGGGDTTIAFRPESGAETVYLKPGQAYKLPGGSRLLNRWTMSNLKGEGTIIGQVLMGEGEFTDNRVSGSVEVIDGGRSRTLANIAFMGFTGVGVVPTQFGHVQLWNPPGTGKRLVVEKVVAGSGTVSSQVHMGYMAAALTGYDQNARSKLLGGALSVGELRYQTSAAALSNVNFGSLFVQQGSMQVFAFNEPIIINPGFGMIMKSLANDNLVTGTYEFFEEAI